MDIGLDTGESRIRLLFNPCFQVKITGLCFCLCLHLAESLASFTQVRCHAISRSSIMLSCPAAKLLLQWSAQTLVWLLPGTVAKPSHDLSFTFSLPRPSRTCTKCKTRRSIQTTEWHKHLCHRSVCAVITCADLHDVSANTANNASQGP